jgi:hypothetical protein
MKGLRNVLAASAVAAALAPGPAAGAASRGLVAVHLTSCIHALAPIDRLLDVSARMRAFPGAKRMGIRFDLLVRRGSEPAFHAVGGRALGFGIWLRSSPGVGTYRYLRTVRNLEAPAAYRMRVRFRWYGKHGAILLARQRVTRTCFEPDLRPDLRVRLVERRTGKVAAWVINAGRTAAGPFTVTLGTRRVELPGLAPGHRVRRMVDRCGVVTVDPDARIDEADETNNTATAPCP